MGGVRLLAARWKMPNMNVSGHARYVASCRAPAPLFQVQSVRGGAARAGGARGEEAAGGGEGEEAVDEAVGRAEAGAVRVEVEAERGGDEDVAEVGAEHLRDDRDLSRDQAGRGEAGRGGEAGGRTLPSVTVLKTGLRTLEERR